MFNVTYCKSYFFLSRTFFKVKNINQYISHKTYLSMLEESWKVACLDVFDSSIMTMKCYVVNGLYIDIEQTSICKGLT